MVQMAFCDLSHMYHKQVTNVSQYVFVIPLWRIVMPPPTQFLVEYLLKCCGAMKHLLQDYQSTQ